MANKNLLIGFGETLTQDVTIPGGGGDKSHPYTVAQAKKRVAQKLTKTLSDIEKVPPEVCANDEVVTKITLHPAYFAKSYYPSYLLRSMNLNTLGSRGVTVKPEKWAIKKHPDKAITTCLYVSGLRENFDHFLSSLERTNMTKSYADDLRKIEEIEYFFGDEKIKHLEDRADLSLEVVLHTPYSGDGVLMQFIEFVSSCGGNCYPEKRRVVQGLTFLPVKLAKKNVSKLAEFTFCRVVRSLPELRLIKPTITRSVENVGTPIFPEYAVNEKPVAIFDGGVGSDALGKWVNEYTFGKDSKPVLDYLEHGGQVTSAYLFGHIQDEVLPSPYTPVDHFRVLDESATGTPDLFDVLSRITNTLDTNAYKFMNLSLGPRLPVEDDDVNVWTSVLDEYLSSGDTFATVAVGNDGEAIAPLNRVQPPSDM